MPRLTNASCIHRELLAVAKEVSPQLKHALQQVGVISIPARSDTSLAHFLCRAVVGQQLSTKAAKSIWRKLLDSANRSSLNSSQFIQQATIEDLRSCGVSKFKAKALKCIVDAELSGSLNSMNCHALEHDVRSDQLSSIWGIGQWTCDMASIFYYQEPDIWPEGDVSVQKSFKNLIDRKKPEKVARQFSPFRTYLALSMWKFLDSSFDQSI